jgi:predicted MPP superfamily phosphohydrolase
VEAGRNTRSATGRDIIKNEFYLIFQIFPFGYITKIVYKGYDYGLFEMGDYTLYTTSGAGTWGPTMRIGNTPEIVVITLQ